MRKFRNGDVVRVRQIYKPNADEKRIIREAACREAGRSRVEINPSTKIHLTTNKVAMNIATISNDPNFGDTDLFDNAYSWKDFTKGIEMTEDDRAIVDFYVYEVTGWKELRGNVTIYVEKGRLVRVDGIGITLWKSN